MPDLPDLIVADVRDWTADRYYERGEQYFQNDRIHRTRREGRTLKAFCHGSRPDPYRVEIALDDDGIAGGSCSCPIGSGGTCKHAVALLLTWIHEPEAFEETDPLNDLLQQQPNDRLVSLILRMVDRHPDLERIARLSLTPAAEPIDEEDLRTNVQSVFENAGGYGADPYYAPRAVADALAAFFDLAEDYAEHDHWAEAATVYRLLLDETREQYVNFRDESGALANVVHECTEQLGELLARAEEDALRKHILDTLLDTYFWDLDLGGYGLGDGARRAILEHSTPHERHRLADHVRDRMPAPSSADAASEERRVFVLGGSDDDWGRSWKREALGGFLLDLEGDTLDDETYLQICREMGRRADLVDRLLQLDRLDDALDAVRDASDRALARIASTFLRHDAGDAVYSLALNRLDDEPHSDLLKWLRDHADDRDDLDRALALSRRYFHRVQSESAYEHLNIAAQRLGQWPDVQSDLHEHLREEGEYALLTRVHLADGDVEAALDTVDEADRSVTWGRNRSRLQIQVAEAAEDEYPDEAIRLYTERARSLIEDRGRENYRQAANYFQRVKALYDEHQPGAWADVIDTLYDDELHRLPAARDEFEKAGLL